MKWVLGLDLRPAGQGALSFASWLGQMPGEDHLIAPVHVLDQAQLLDVLRHEHLDDVRREANQVATAQLRRAKLEVFADLDVVELGPTVEETLEARAAALDASAILVGRQARSGERRVVRLGAAARKLVRRLHRPVVVVPPDFEVAARGPVIVATDVGPASAGAARFAAMFAATVGRPLLVAHVVPSYEEAFLPAATLQQFHHQLGLERERELERWAAEHGLGEAPRVVAHGDVVDRLIGIAEREQACLLVVGSRRLNAVERIFAASVGTDLTRHAACPVAIVPHTD